ncbi:MAG: hypothetical protein K0B11_16015 [Mariniphaga sp.]|nr:hypothetical protein [Mariniphaga sp.]
MRKICILFLIIVFPTFSFAQNDEVAWDYPVMPGSEEWLNIKVYSKRLEQLNIPNDILTRISTKQLVKTCLSYPQIELIFTRNDLITGMSYVSTLFNGFVELSKRKDAGIELMRIYQSFEPFDYQTMEKSAQIQHKKDFIVIELLLSSPVILKNMNKAERIELLKESFKKYEAKAKYWGKFYLEQISPNLLIMAQIIEIDELTIKNSSKLKGDMEILLKTGITRDIAFVTELIDEVTIYLNNK